MAKSVIKFWDKIIISLLVIMGVFNNCNRNNPPIHEDTDEVSNSESDTVKQIISDTTKASISDTIYPGVVTATMYGIPSADFEIIEENEKLEEDIESFEENEE